MLDQITPAGLDRLRYSDIATLYDARRLGSTGLCRPLLGVERAPRSRSVSARLGRCTRDNSDNRLITRVGSLTRSPFRKIAGGYE